MVLMFNLGRRLYSEQLCSLISFVFQEKQQNVWKFKMKELGKPIFLGENNQAGSLKCEEHISLKIDP